MEARANLTARRAKMDADAKVKAAEAKLADLEAKVKEVEKNDRRATGADRIAGGEPAPAARGLVAIKAEMQTALQGATGNRTAQIRRDFRYKAQNAGFRPDW
jgi:hypothetical protein